jgi:hypothetical protein
LLYDKKAASLEFAKAMSHYHDLAQDATNAVNGGESLKNPEHLERQDLFVTRAETVLRPFFRYCRYELREAGEQTVKEPIWSDTSATTTGSVADVSYTYRGQTIQIENKDLHVLMLKLQSFSTAIAGTTKQESTFLQSLSTLDDALEIIKTSMQSLYKMKAGPAVNSERHQLDLWRGYLQSKKTHLVMDHTEGLLNGIKNHGERVHVYVTLLKHAQSLLQLPGPKAREGAGDGGFANVVEEEDEFALQVQATILRIRALKCYHMGMYYYHECERLEEAATLLEHSESLTKRALEEIAACDEDMAHAENYVTELQLLLNEKLVGSKICVAAAQLAVQCQDIIGAPPKPKTIKTSRPLMQRLDEWDAGDVLADVPPMFMPIPQKPVFYDLAWDYVSDMTDQLEVIQNHIDEQTGAKEEAVHELNAETTSSSGGSLFGWLTGK